jgi:hypothetical protein
MANENSIAKQIEQTADYHPPNIYNLLSFFSSLSTTSDYLSAEYIPLSQIPFSAKNVKPFIIGVLPPSANVTGRNLDRSASLSSILGTPAAGTSSGTSGGSNAGFNQDARDKALALAQSYVGLSTNASTNERYLNLLADPAIDPLSTAVALSEQASCAITVRGWLRELGLNEPELTNPYKWSMANADVLAIAARKGARLDKFGKFSVTPKPGDIFYITGGQQHMAIIETITSGSAEAGYFTERDISGGQNVAGYRGISRSDRVWTRQEDGSWEVHRAGGKDLVGGDGLHLYALVDLDKMLSGVDIDANTHPVNADSTAGWQGSGSASAQVASKENSKTANTSLDTSGLGQKFQDVQRAAAKAVKLAIDQMANTPPLRMLVNPASFKVSSEKVVSDGNWGRNGPIVEHWGEQQDKVEGSGKLAGFYAIDANGGSLGSVGNSPGLTRMARNFSLSYQNFLSLWLLYRNNGGVWLPDATSTQTQKTTNLALVGSIYIFYDNIIYIGSFDSFNVTESDLSPFTLEYSFSFSVRATYLLDQTDPHFTYGAPKSFPLGTPSV